MLPTDAALLAAGAIGMIVATIHGTLIQRLIVRPLDRLSESGGAQMAASTRRLVPALIQFSTYNWFLAGAALVAAALWGGTSVKAVAGGFAASSYAYGALVNIWATRARHPGGWLYVLAVALILLGLA